MANNVADAKAAIYARLASAPVFHPASASLFEDWTLQGGDVVTVDSGTDHYSLPIYGMKIKWDGSTKVDIASTGSIHREAIEKMAQKDISRSSSNYRSQRKRNDRVEFIVGIDENGQYFIDHPGAITLSINNANESVAHIEADHVNISAYSTFHSLAGTLEYDANGRVIIHDAGGVYVERTSSGTSAYFGVYDEQTLTGGICVTKINDGSTTLKINADRIKIGDYGQSTITLNDTFEINASGELYSKKPLRVNGIVNCVNHLYLSKDNVGSLVTTDIASGVYDLRINQSGNTYTLQKQLNDPNDSTWKDVGTFSRAVSSFNSSWSNGVCTVTAQPQGQQATIKLSNVSGSNSITSNGTYTYTVMYEDSNGNDQSTGLTKTISVNVPNTGGTVTVGNIYYNDTSAPSGYTKATTISNYVSAGHKYVYFTIYLDGVAVRKFYIET